MAEASGTVQDGFLPVEGARLYYRVEGSGPPVVFIHAGVAEYSMWDAQAAALSDRYRVVRYDTRGFGQSFSEPGPASNLEDLRALLRHLEVDRTVVVGISQGAMIALNFTLAHPELVSALVWVAGGIGGLEGPHPTEAERALFGEYEALLAKRDLEGLADLAARTWADGPGQPAGRAPASVRDYVHDATLRQSREHTAEVTPVLLDPPAAGRLSEIRVPTLVVVGDLDESGTQFAADRLAEGVARARKVVFPGVAHMVNLERPEEFNALLEEFLSSL